MTIEAPAEIPRRDSATSLLLTVLGEFVLPAGGAAWTTTLVTAIGALGVGEKNGRQAIARVGEQGLIEGSRHGRAVRWQLTDTGRRLLESGAQRIYTFGRGGVEWNGEWLVAHCPVAESQRTRRRRVRSQLAFLGFGELAPSLLVSPHVDRQPQLRATLDDLGLGDDSVVMRSTMLGRDTDVVARAWDLDSLARSYELFVDEHAADVEEADGASRFRAVVELVHAWRRFPFVDPELPDELLPDGWIGQRASAMFHARHGEWSPPAQAWFADVDG